MGSNYVSGVYSASFSISEFSTSSLTTEIKNAGSATFSEIWQSLDETIGYITSSLIVKSVNRTTFDNSTQKLFVNITNLRHEYSQGVVSRFRIFVEDITRTVRYVKKTV